MTEDQFRKLLAEQSKAIAEQFDQKLEARSEQFRKILNHSLATLCGIINLESRARMDAMEAQLNHIYNKLDGIAKRLDDDDQERAAAGHQLTRHETWIRQLGETTGTKLATESER